MKIYDCKCEECKAEFQAVLGDKEDKVKCPSCDSEKIKMTESEMEFGCGGGCAGCGGGCGEPEVK